MSDLVTRQDLWTALSLVIGNMWLIAGLVLVPKGNPLKGPCIVIAFLWITMSFVWGFVPS